MRYRVLPYRQGSRSASALAEALGGRVLRLEGSRYRPRNTDVIINWGRTDPYGYAPAVLLNHFDMVRNASNKLTFFQLMSENNADIIPPFYTNQGDIPDEAFPIVCRTVLAGHSGDGIVIANSRDELVPARLYVKYIKKQDEYRIHVGMYSRVPIDGDPAPNTSIISVQRKARRIDHDNPNFQIRNHANGFNFVRNEVHPPPAVVASAERALLATGLDFGAVDVIWNARQERAYVLEINTAPGLEGQTITDYATFFRSIAE